MELELIKEEDVIQENNLKKYDGLYMQRISPHVGRLKALIKDSNNGEGNGEVIIKIKDLKSLMGDEFKDKNVNSFYMMVKQILLEHGINVKLYHHFGANIIISAAKEEEIKPYIETRRDSRIRMAKKAGYDRFADYQRDCPYRKKAHPLNMYDKEDKKYFVNIGRRYVSIIFPNAEINMNSLASRYLEEEKRGYDWISNGLKVKHIASTLKHRVEKGSERDLFQWGIANNNRCDIFILTAWGDSEDLELMKAWIFKAHEDVNGKEFWNRSTLLISTHDRSIEKYSKWEVDYDRLELIREHIRVDKEKELKEE